MPFRERERVTTPGGGETRVQQAEKHEADINYIVNNYVRSGEVNVPQIAEGVYGDFSDVADFKTCMDRVRDAETAFMELPSNIREAARHDPANLIDLAYNPDRRAEAEALGILEGDPVAREETTAPAGGAAAAPPAPVTAAPVETPPSGGEPAQ